MRNRHAHADVLAVGAVSGLSVGSGAGTSLVRFSTHHQSPRGAGSRHHLGDTACARLVSPPAPSLSGPHCHCIGRRYRPRSEGRSRHEFPVMMAQLERKICGSAGLVLPDSSSQSLPQYATTRDGEAQRSLHRQVQATAAEATREHAEVASALEGFRGAIVLIAGTGTGSRK